MQLYLVVRHLSIYHKQTQKHTYIYRDTPVSRLCLPHIYIQFGCMYAVCRLYFLHVF